MPKKPDSFYWEKAPPFPSEPRRHDKRGQVASEEFIIPESEKQAYLDANSPFVDVPRLNERLYDIHAGKTFLVRDFKVVRVRGMNFICSPYYFESGGTIIDWVEPDGFEQTAGDA